MKFIEQNIPGVYLIEMEPFKDERGSFARQFCLKELQHNGLEFSMCQCNRVTRTRERYGGCTIKKTLFRKSKLFLVCAGVFLMLW